MVILALHVCPTAHPSLATSVLHARTSTASRRPSPRKLLQVMHRRNTQDEPPTQIRDDGEVLRALSIAALHEEVLELLERRVHRDHLVRVRLPPELDHGG